MWPFRNKPSQATFKAKVADFWKWYAKNADRFYEVIENERCSQLSDEISDAVDRLAPGLAWVFGPGENKQGHSLTLSGEGQTTKQFATEYWCAQAPRLDGWTFHASRQPADEIRGFKFDIHNVGVFEPKQLWVHLWPDDQDEDIDITAWHPLYSQLADLDKGQSLFLLLDEILGEHGTQNWIGEIKFADNLLKESVPIWELRDFVQRTAAERGWKKGKPTDMYTGYQVNQQRQGIRGDVFIGTTRCRRLLLDFMDNQGPVEHPLPQSGVDFVFVSFPSEILPKGGEVDFRCEIEDEIAAVLAENKSGAGLGGATGSANTYVDFVIYDGDESVRQIQQMLRKQRLPKETAIRYFTEDKASQVWRI